MLPERLILLLLELYTVVPSLPATGKVLTSPIADRRVNYHIANRAIYARHTDHVTAALDIKDYPADLQLVKPTKRNIGWKVTEAVLKSRNRDPSLRASRKCVQYSYPDSAELMATPVEKKVPCGDEKSNDVQDNKRRTYQRRGIYGSNQRPISVYRLPRKGKSSEEGLSVYNEEGGTKRSRHPRSPVKVSEYPSSEFSKEMYRRVFEWIGSDGSTANNDTNSEEEKILTKDDIKELVV